MPLQSPIGVPQTDDPVGCYSPAARVVQMEEYHIPDSDSIDALIPHIEYSFYRRVKWATIGIRHKDQKVEKMPQQVLKFQEFVISRDIWTQEQIEDLEEFFDQHKGSAYPFWFTAPDDNIEYAVRFLEDTLEVEFPSATVRKCSFTLAEAGDIDNTINNGLVYPNYVEPVSPIFIAGATYDDGDTIQGFLDDATLDSSYSVLFVADNGTEPYTWEIPSDSSPIPRGMALDSSGVLSGSPEEVGLFSFTLKVTDSAVDPSFHQYAERQATAFRDFQLRVTV